jgi:hypothetical protein
MSGRDDEYHLNIPHISLLKYGWGRTVRMKESVSLAFLKRLSISSYSFGL